MEKRNIPFWSNPLKWACNTAYSAAARILPEACYATPQRQQATAFVEGLFAGYAAATLGKHVVYPLTFQQMGVPLEEIVEISLSATAGAASIPPLIAPDAYRRWAAENPTYTWGVAGVMAGASAKAVQELFF
ncbi:hypothetical protein HY491_03445 [Candidatus Woesearchaeota archaeon]|nr:hypothetical protein [Candidatus Woesearchaeota archaeon]